MFVLRGYSRSGTVMLRTALDTHDHIRCFDDLFGKKYADKLNRLSINEHLQSFKLRPTDGFTAYGGVVDGPPHVQRAMREIWAEVEIKQTPVVAIERKDHIRRTASEVIAKTTGVWHVKLKDKPNRTTQRVVLSVDQLMRSVDAAREAHELTASMFPWSHVVYYEELLVDWDIQMQQVLEYIGVGNAILGASTRRQEVRPIRHIVHNYEELKAELYDSDPTLFDIAEQTDVLFRQP